MVALPDAGECIALGYLPASLVEAPAQHLAVEVLGDRIPGKVSVGPLFVGRGTRMRGRIDTHEGAAAAYV